MGREGPRHGRRRHAALFPVAVSAAKTLGADDDLVSQFTAAQKKLPPLPRTDAAIRTEVLTAADSLGDDVTAVSAEPTAQTHKSENLDLDRSGATA